MQRRTRAQLLRDPRLRVTVRSDAGDDRPHRLKLGLFVGTERREVESGPRVVRLRGTATRRLTFRLSRRALAVLRESGAAGLAVIAEQTVGTGIRATRGGFTSDGLAFRR